MEQITDIQETTAMDLGALLDAGDDAVVTLVAGETRLMAHRAVVAARSPVLAAMLGPDSSAQVLVPDVEGPVLRQLLAYLYTRQVPQLPTMAPQLLLAADQYSLPGLKAACEWQVAGRLAVENAASAAVLALRHGCPRLRRAAIAFIKGHTHQVMMSQGWADAVVSHPHCVVELTRLITEPPAATSSPTPADSGTSHHPTTELLSKHNDYRDHGRIPTSGATPTAASCQTPSPGDTGDPHSRLAAPKDSETRHQPATELHTKYSDCSNHGRITTSGRTPTTAFCQNPSSGDTGDSHLRSLPEEESGKRLLQAAMEGSVQELRLLLAAGEDVGTRDGRDMTALHWAVVGGHAEAARCLLAAGAAADARDVMRNTALHFAAAGDHGAIVRLLVAAGAHPDARNLYGRTPLYCAALNGHAEAAAALLEAGADRRSRDDTGRTPADMARLKNHPDLVQMLT